MPLFDFTSGNPNNLVAGLNASMADVQGPLNDIKGRLNGTNGTLDETNVPNLSAAFTHWRTVLWTDGQLNTATIASASAWIMYPGSAGVAGTVLPGASSNSAALSFYLDPADWAANSRITKLRIRWQIIVNAVAPGITFTPGLYPVATWGGGSGAYPTIATLGTVVTGSTAALTTPSAGMNAPVVSSEFNAPAPGNYVFALTSSGAMAAGSNATLHGQMQFREV